MIRIVIDTNVVASAIFFGGRPAEVIKLVLENKTTAIATQEIIDEYQETIDYLLHKYKGKELLFSATPIFASMTLISCDSQVKYAGIQMMTSLYRVLRRGVVSIS